MTLSLAIEVIPHCTRCEAPGLSCRPSPGVVRLARRCCPGGNRRISLCPHRVADIVGALTAWTRSDSNRQTVSLQGSCSTIGATGPWWPATARRNIESLHIHDGLRPNAPRGPGSGRPASREGASRLSFPSGRMDRPEHFAARHAPEAAEGTPDPKVFPSACRPVRCVPSDTYRRPWDTGGANGERCRPPFCF